MPIVQSSAPTGPKIRGIADIVFCFDVTGSMQPCIDGVKNNVRTFIDQLKAGSANQPVDWRAVAVGYRDIGDGAAPAFEGFMNSFTNDFTTLYSQIDSLEAKGGGDEPESLLDALYKIGSELKWPNPIGASHRIIIVFTDATCQPELDPSTTSGDRSPNAVVTILSDIHAKLFLYGPDFEIYRNVLATIPKSLFKSLGADTEEVQRDIQNASFADIMAQLGKTVSQSAVMPVMAGGSSGVAP